MNRRAIVMPLVSLLLGLLAVAAPAAAQVRYPDRIGERNFIADTAGMITIEDQAKVLSTCTTLLDQRGVALVVVTISSMADFGATNWTIERYAHNLFDEWGISTRAHNLGILLLVSKGDRKVRVELGAGWNHERDNAAAAIVNGTIVPQFKAGKFSEGIRQGVDALASQIGGLGAAGVAPTAKQAPPMAAGQAPAQVVPPSRGRNPASFMGPLVCIFGAVVLIVGFIVVSRIRRSVGGAIGGGLPGAGIGTGMGGMGPGPYGWGGGWGGGGGGGFGGFWPGLFVGQWLGGRHSGSQQQSGTSGSSGWFGGGSSGGGGGFLGGGGGFGGGGVGGSFGGGFSGGGGATGSW